MFNFYFTGGVPAEADDLVGDNVLLSYATDRRGIIKRYDRGRSTFVDSGAFTAYTKGINVDIDEYVNFVNAYDEYISYFAQLDVIPGSYGLSAEQTTDITLKNYLYMLSRTKSPCKLIPVFHRGSNLNYLKQLIHTGTEYIGLGAMAKVPEKERAIWLTEVFKLIPSQVKVHAFGLTSFDLLERFPFYSADSTSWLIYAVNGRLITDFGNYIVISQGRKKLRCHVEHKGELIKDTLYDFIRERGFEPEQLINDPKSRLLWNIKYMLEWVNKYQYKPAKQVSQTKLF